jgi:metallo-beta-lactamase family protein
LDYRQWGINALNINNQNGISCLGRIGAEMSEMFLSFIIFDYQETMEVIFDEQPKVRIAAKEW